MKVNIYLLKVQQLPNFYAACLLLRFITLRKNIAFDLPISCWKITSVWNYIVFWIKSRWYASGTHVTHDKIIQKKPKKQRSFLNGRSFNSFQSLFAQRTSGSLFFQCNSSWKDLMNTWLWNLKWFNDTTLNIFHHNIKEAYYF